MKKIFLFLLLPLLAFVKPIVHYDDSIHVPYAGLTYYFSTTDGDDSRSAAQAQNQATPWKTLTKLNSVQSTLIAGDAVKLKRGDVFEGQITIGKAGIFYDAYGSGSNPIVSGFYTVPAWTDQGGGRYSATIPGGLSTTGVVYMDNVFQAMGRYPKSGYFNINSGTNTSITSTSNTGNNPNNFATAPNCVGGEINWRSQHWAMWRASVSSQTSTTIGFTAYPSTSGGPTETPKTNFGFFLQNHPNTCTVLGEWAYNTTSHTLTVFFGGPGPGSHVVKISSKSALVTNAGFASVSLNNISFVGANDYILNYQGALSNSIDHCQLDGAGIYGIYANGNTDNIRVTHTSINHANSNGIQFAGGGSANADGGYMEDDTLMNVGAVGGMGGSGEGQYFAIQNIKNSGIVRRCRITNTGYIPIAFSGTNNLCDSNYIDNFCTVKDDGGGIYHGGFSVAGSMIRKNIILNGIGVPQGTPDNEFRAHGVYVDDGGNGSTIDQNVIAHMGDAGFFNHAGFNEVLTNNIIYDCKVASVRHYNNNNDGTSGATANIVQTGNILYARVSTQLCLTSSGGTIEPRLFYSTLDNNYYCRPTAETNVITQIAPTNKSFTLATWKTWTGKDANSHVTAVTPVANVNDQRFEYNASSTTANISLSGNNYTDPTGVGYTGTLNLAPWSGKILIKTAGTGNSPPNVNAGTDIVLNLPINSVAMAATTSDPDGSIATWAWTKTSGPASYNISNAAIEDPTINNLSAGVYVFTLTVTDNLGAVRTDDVQITVNAGNSPPSSSAGADQSLPPGTTSTTLTGSASDPGGAIDSVRWVQSAGPVTAIIVSPTSNSTVINGMSASGQYRFIFTAYDNGGAATSDEVIVVINNPIPPGGRFDFRRFLYHPIASGDSLLWEVQFDRDIVRYEVERSSDNVTWTRIGTSTPSQLWYFDPYPMTTICVKKWWFFCTQKKTVYTTTHFYYRIKAVDNALSTYYSTAIKT